MNQFENSTLPPTISRVNFLRALRRPAAHARVVGVADPVGAAVFAEDELAFEHVEAAVAIRGRVAVRTGDEPALESAGAVGERGGLVEARGARAGEVERAGAGLHERAARLHEVGGDREVVADVVDRGLGVDRRVVRERAVRPAAVRSVVAERAGADGDEAGLAEARRRPRGRHAVRDERAAAERGGGRVGVLRVEMHDAAAAGARVDAHGGGGDNGRDVRLDAVAGVDGDVGGKHGQRQADATCRQAKEALRARFHRRDVLSSADILSKIPTAVLNHRCTSVLFFAIYNQSRTTKMCCYYKATEPGQRERALQCARGRTVKA